MTKLDQIKQLAMDLSQDEQELLGLWLIHHQEERQAQEVEVAWKPILDRRIAEINSDEVQMIPQEQVLKKFREQFGIED